MRSLATAFSAAAAIPALAMGLSSKVIVTGAGGQTGQSLFRKMLASGEFDPIGIVRTQSSKSELVKSGVPESSVIVIDVAASPDKLKEATKNCSAFCICTSAKPSPTGEMDDETGRPIFGYPHGSPEAVDWIGQKNQIDACPKGTHVVLCSSMGGTDPSHSLNTLGRTTNADGTTSGGNILKWKRKAEIYLIESGLPYTIVHPGGLLNEPGGERELVLGVDDSMEGTDSRTVPREDVAEVMLNALRFPKSFGNRSFDLRAKPAGDGTPTTDFEALAAMIEGKNCDYSLGESA